jgi:uncharacterized protein YecT (DUF1311 family)
MSTLLALALLLQSSTSDVYPIDPDCSEAADGSTVGISECFSRQAGVWEKRLDFEYSEALKRREVDHAALRKGQEAWIKFRDLNCETYRSVQGTISIILTGRCWLEMTRNRALELHGMTWIG